MYCNRALHFFYIKECCHSLFMTERISGPSMDRMRGTSTCPATSEGVYPVCNISILKYVCDVNRIELKGTAELLRKLAGKYDSPATDD